MKHVFLCSWQMWSLCPEWGSWWGCAPEKQITTWLSLTGSSPPRASLWRHCRRTRYGPDQHRHVTLRLSPCWICRFQRVSLSSTSTPNCATWRKMKGFPPPCQTSCLSWSTATRWTPASRRRGRAETSSTPSTGAAWRTSTPSSTTGCTATSTRWVLLILLHVTNQSWTEAGV